VRDGAGQVQPTWLSRRQSLQLAPLEGGNMRVGRAEQEQLAAERERERGAAAAAAAAREIVRV